MLLIHVLCCVRVLLWQMVNRGELPEPASACQRRPHGQAHTEGAGRHVNERAGPPGPSKGQVHRPLLRRHARLGRGQRRRLHGRVRLPSAFVSFAFPLHIPRAPHPPVLLSADCCLPVRNCNLCCLCVCCLCGGLGGHHQVLRDRAEGRTRRGGGDVWRGLSAARAWRTGRWRRVRMRVSR